MRFISYEVLLGALQEYGTDAVYEKLEALFYAEPLVFINLDGEAIFTPYDALELWDWLENLANKFHKEVVL
jgi:hypothetical protein